MTIRKEHISESEDLLSIFLKVGDLHAVFRLHGAEAFVELQSRMIIKSWTSSPLTGGAGGIRTPHSRLHYKLKMHLSGRDDAYTRRNASLIPSILFDPKQHARLQAAALLFFRTSL